MSIYRGFTIWIIPLLAGNVMFAFTQIPGTILLFFALLVYTFVRIMMLLLSSFGEKLEDSIEHMSAAVHSDFVTSRRLAWLLILCVAELAYHVQWVSLGTSYILAASILHLFGAVLHKRFGIPI